MRVLKLWMLGLALIAAAASLGCGKKAEQATTESSSDSLVASNPTERQSGDITPQTTYQEPPKTQAPPPAPAPRTTRPAQKPAPKPAPAEAPSVTMASGTAVKVEVTAAITSETAHAGDAWTGTVKDNIIVGDRVLIPAGSTVNGVVRASTPAKKGDRAMLLLGVSSVNVNGKDIAVSASTDSIVAGSTRARNLGAIGGGAAAGAVIGHAIGGSGKGSVIGALIGGAATTALVSGSKGYQVTVKSGTEITFTTDGAVKFKQ